MSYSEKIKKIEMPESDGPVGAVSELILDQGYRWGRDDAAQIAAQADATIAELRAEVEGLKATIDKLPLTADGVRVVPNVDRVWIDPENKSGWMGEQEIHGVWDDEDKYIPSPLILIQSWAHHGDHCWMMHESCDEGFHWQGPLFSTETAARAAAGKGSR